MKNKPSTAFILGIVACFCQPAFSGNGETKNNSDKTQHVFKLPEGITTSDFQANTIILKLKPAYRNQAQKNGINVQQLMNVFNELGVQEVTKLFPMHAPPARVTDEMGNPYIDLSLLYEVIYSNGISIEKAINKIISTGMVAYAEPRYVYATHGIANSVREIDEALAAFNPNDPSIGQQYFIGRIKCPDAWGINATTARGDTNVVIGIVDTGTDIDHPDLKSKIKYNYKDPVNNVDDDNDGYIDNFRGWDVSDKDNNPNVDNANNVHGSHVSGCAAAATNNGAGVASPGFNCKFLPVKSSKASTTGVIDNGYEGIIYAADHGCQIINNSWGGPAGGQFGQDAITYATINKQCLVVASAGNDSKEQTNYPAAYNYVLSVAATTSTDAKSSFSTFAYSVDVCSPGGGIYSTVYNNTYTSMDGTSMAGPICAGAAGIVKSFFPSYTGLQVGEQLKVTADNIYAVGSNSSYKDKLGTGRINLYRALTESSPSVKMSPITIIDGNDNVFIAGDTLLITGKFVNYLAAASNVTATLSSTNTDVTILNPALNVGSLATLATFDVNKSNAYKVLIKSSASTNEKVLFKINCADGAYSGDQYFSVTVNVDYINIDINDVASTNTSRGRIGYNASDIAAGGLGFVYNDTSSLTYEAGLMIGVSSSKVSDNVRGSGTTGDVDFVSTQAVKERIPALKSEFETFGVFNDNGASSKIGVQVKHNTYAWTTAGDRKYIIFEYIIKNVSGASISNLYAGILSDWDITERTAGNNKAATNSGNKLGYAYSAVDPKLYAGIRLLTKGPFLHYAIDNVAGGGGGVDIQDKTNQFSTGEKYTTLSTNRAAAGEAAATGGDILSVVSSGPFTIANNDTVKVAFAILAGNDLNELITSSQNAQIKYDNVVTDISTAFAVNSEFVLKQNYPNPVNDAKTIIEFNIPEKAQAELALYNSIGQKIKTVFNSQLNAGTHQWNVDVSELNNGLYFYELKAGNQKATMKMIIQK